MAKVRLIGLTGSDYSHEVSAIVEVDTTTCDRTLWYHSYGAVRHAATNGGQEPGYAEIELVDAPVRQMTHAQRARAYYEEMIYLRGQYHEAINLFKFSLRPYDQGDEECRGCESSINNCVCYDDAAIDVDMWNSEEETVKLLYTAFGYMRVDKETFDVNTQIGDQTSTVVDDEIASKGLHISSENTANFQIDAGDVIHYNGFGRIDCVDRKSAPVGYYVVTET